MKIDIYLYDKLRVKVSSSIIGKSFENKATILKFNLSDLSLPDDSNFYLDIEKADGTKIKSSLLKVKDDLVIYPVTNDLLDSTGILKIEPIVYSDFNVVSKYPTIEFLVIESINSIDEVLTEHPDFVVEFEKLRKVIKIDGEGNKFLNDAGEYVGIENASTIPASNVIFDDTETLEDKLANGTLKGEIGPEGPPGQKGESFKYSDFTEEQLEFLRGPQGEIGPEGPPGQKGDTPDLTGYATETYVNNLIGNINNVLSTLTEVQK